MKRILSLDGGGIRGVFSLQILARIEELFRREYNRPTLVLADVFHLFAGTSTGAIIAAALSWGMAVRDVDRMYAERGPEMFAKGPWHRRWKSKYRADAIAALFRSLFSEDEAGTVPALLGSKRLGATLVIVMRNASTGSPWPVSNNPHAAFNDPTLPDCNLNIPLWQLLRASTAAPSYFPPEEITLAGDRHLFVDGGITPFNNPALIAVLMATLSPYRLCWPAGREALHVVSVGTGSARARLPRKVAAKIHMMDQVAFAIPALIQAAAVEQDLLCRVLGDCVYGAPIDREVGDVCHPTLLTPAEQKFTYVRYDQSVEAMLAAHGDSSRATAALDDVGLIPLLQTAGRTYADEHVRREHLYPRPTAGALVNDPR